MRRRSRTFSVPQRAHSPDKVRCPIMTNVANEVAAADGSKPATLVSIDEAQPLSRRIRAVHWLYYASMTLGLPLWLLVTVMLVAWLRFALSPLPDIGPIEYQFPSAAETGVLKAAGIAFFMVYLAAFIWAHRITRQPWVVFASMLLPVLTFSYAVVFFPITDSNAEQRTWLTYLGSLALILATGAVASAVADRHHPPARQASQA
jgi:hypothetical protein